MSIVDYADAEAKHTIGDHEWPHSMSDIVQSLVSAGLVIEQLHEFPYCAGPIVAGCQIVEQFSSSHAYYGRVEAPSDMPLMFSLRARAPAVSRP